MELLEQHRLVLKELVSVMTAAANKISRHEITAKTLLYESSDREGYHDQLREKAIVLSELADNVALCDNLPLHLKALIQQRIGSFSFEADRALRLDSVFYMSVLLYPEDYLEGTPNELETFIKYLIQL